jgi:hypothetical protein
LRDGRKFRVLSFAMAEAKGDPTPGSSSRSRGRAQWPDDDKNVVKKQLDDLLTKKQLQDLAR